MASSQSTARWRLNGTLWPAVVLLGLFFLIFEFTGLDLWVQDLFFDSATQQWVVDTHSSGLRFWFYDAPKIVIIIIGLGVLTLAVIPKSWRAKLPCSAVLRRNLWVAVLTIATVPVVIGQLKATTNIFCPSSIRHYGGDVAYVRVLESYPEDDKPERRGRCFPAGHASGGFALLALMGLATTRRRQWVGLALGLGFGWSMGLYQMMNGLHYLSHTVVTMVLAWIIFILWRRVFRVR